MTATEFKDALARAMGVIDSIGQGGNTKHSISQRSAMVELVLLQVRAGELKPAIYLQHPAHLPEGNELKQLMASGATKDAQLRADAREWVVINRREASSAMVSLRNAIEACRIANELLNDPDAPEVLYDWMKEIDAYVRTTFACDTTRAPQERAELDAWCLSVIMRTNPVPQWLREYRGPILDVEQPKTVQGAMRSHAETDDD